MFPNSALIIILLVSLSEIKSSPVPEWNIANAKMSSPVQFKIIHTLQKRSLDNSNSNSGYDIELMAFDETHVLKLRSPAESLFSDDFRYSEVDADEDGKFLKIDRTPSKREIAAAEEHIYVDADTNSVLKVRDVDGELHLDGMVHNMRISRDANKRIHEATIGNDATMHGNHSDSLDLNRPLAKPRGISSGPISVTAEVVLLFDYENSKLFNFDNIKIMDYLAVLLNSVGSRYATVNDPKISFKLSGILSIKTPAGQPFIEKNKVEGNKVDPLKVMDLYQEWLYENSKDFPPHDLISLIYAQERIVGGMNGVSIKSGVCWTNSSKKRDLSASIVHDSGGSWFGSFILTHEFAHCFGADHDGEGFGGHGCDPDVDYIMGGGEHKMKNKYTFSPCSIESFKNLIQSTGGACLFRQDNPHPPPAITAYVGDRMTLNELCKKRTKDPTGAVMSEVPNEQCLQMACKTLQETWEVDPKYGRMKWITEKHFKYDEPAGENSPCGKNGGKCKVGVCVGG